MGKLLVFVIGLLALLYFLPIWKTTYDGIMNNTTGVLSWGTYTPFETLVMTSAPIAVPAVGVLALLIYLGKRREQDGD